MRGRHVLGVLVLGLLLAAGCQRRTQLVPASADSTVVPRDSFTIDASQAQQAWDDPLRGAEAARLSAELIRADLARRPDQPWPPRVRALLDSLDLGGEVAADRRVTVVNFFSRAHPEGGSWPWLFWPAASGARARALSGQGLQLLEVASRGRPGTSEPSAVAVLYGRRAASGQAPLLMVWNDLGNPASEPSQTLGADSLGGSGRGNLQSLGDTTVALVTRTFRGVPHFEECATCPHVFTVRRFVWEGAGFHKTDEQAIASPYSSFVQFIAALTANDLAAAQRWVADPLVLEAAKRYGMDVPSRGIWRVAPATDESARDMVFFRGQQEAYRVSFDSRGDDWVITGIVPTTRSVE